MTWTCPQCGGELDQRKINHKNISLEGLPQDEDSLEQIIEYYDTGYKKHPCDMWYYHCQHCAAEIERKTKEILKEPDNMFSDFVFFRNDNCYGFFNDKWFFIEEKVLLT